MGRASRFHSDVDVAVLRRDQHDLRLHLELRAFIPRKVVDGELVEWKVGDWLELPVHEIHVKSAAGKTFGFELLLNECQDDLWVYRRDQRIRLPLALAIQSPGHLPHLAPEIALLFKSKSPTAVDENDFAAAVPHLSPDQRRWLMESLSISRPSHPWAEMLEAEAGEKL